jgi:hypothetical protein
MVTISEIEIGQKLLAVLKAYGFYSTAADAQIKLLNDNLLGKRFSIEIMSKTTGSTQGVLHGPQEKDGKPPIDQTELNLRMTDFCLVLQRKAGVASDHSICSDRGFGGSGTRFEVEIDSLNKALDEMLTEKKLGHSMS